VSPALGWAGQGRLFCRPLSKNFLAKPSESAAEGRGLGEEFCHAQAEFYLKAGIRILPKIGSDFGQDKQPINKVFVSRIARGFASCFGKCIFQQFPKVFIFYTNCSLPQERIRANLFQEIFLFEKISS